MQIMVKLAATITYKGSAYKGWQSQPHGNTIQQTLEKILFQILRQPISTFVSGRTDSGVHALAQVVHFDLPDELAKWMDKSKIAALPKLLYSLNECLPDDILITRLKKVAADFHAQKSAKKKTYCYYLYQSPFRHPFLQETHWQIPYHLDPKAMRVALKMIVGTHDFKSFCAQDATTKTTIRKIFKANLKIIKKGELFGQVILEGDLWILTFEGSGFLKQMVRNLVGTLVNVARGNKTVDEFRDILKACDRTKAGMAAPAKGLFLMRVDY